MKPRTAFTLAALLLAVGLWLLTPADRGAEQAAPPSGTPAAAPSSMEPSPTWPTSAATAAGHRIPTAQATRPTATTVRESAIAGEIETFRALKR